VADMPSGVAAVVVTAGMSAAVGPGAGGSATLVSATGAGAGSAAGSVGAGAAGVARGVVVSDLAYCAFI